MAQAVSSETTILPFLNGMAHIEAPNERSGKSRALGGWCAMSIAINDEGQILHLQSLHGLSFGEQDEVQSARIAALAAALSDAKFGAMAVDAIMYAMGKKWIFIASSAGISSLTVGSFNECVATGSLHSFARGKMAIDRLILILTAPNSLLMEFMLLDVEAGKPSEADCGLLQRESRGTQPSPLLRGIYAHARTYQSRRLREQYFARAA